MNQRNPLLSFRKLIPSDSSQSSILNSTYNLITGLWEMEKRPTIEELLNSTPIMGTTLITKTREGIDRSEGSN
ncbi:hypothetical protein [Brevibacillus thermoruber]|jgi:hypothetical protein|uniref:hypothetical protein n=1 Tax=Brevibacillus thermoruber TaxID=33942 RepID=UPI0012E02D65|nr:hypothetical protein [Brevibacillus thermoruber]